MEVALSENSDAKQTASTERMEQRAVIKFCIKVGMTPTDTWKIFNRPKEGSSCSRTLVFEWHRRFREGRVEVTDDARPGRPSTASMNVRKALDIISSDR